MSFDSKSAHDIGSLKGPLVAAHRGGFFGAQNTLAQFRSTMAVGDTDILEMDLQRTHDGVVVVYHDPDLQSKTDCAGTIGTLTDGYVGGCRLHNGQLLSRFADVLQAVSGRTIIDAEFKTNAVIAPAIRLVTERHMESSVYFQLGDDRDKYIAARRVSSSVYLQFKAASDADIAWALALNDPRVRIIEMDRDFVSPNRIREVHAGGKLVSENSFRYQYTEERFSASCNQVFSQGIDIAVTNNPSSCKLQRHAPPDGFADRWIYGLLSRQHVRPAMRTISSDAARAMHGLRSLVE
jgi:glycerophosphoryl diester phosphodiesterase